MSSLPSSAILKTQEDKVNDLTLLNSLKCRGNPLAVTLPGRDASLGKISVEKYNSDVNPTGQPLKRGTPVQIPDPDRPGEKIYFKVP